MNLIQILIYSIIIVMFIFKVTESILNFKNKEKEIPKEVQDVYDKQKYQEFLKYNDLNFKVNTFKKIIDLVINIVFLLSGFYLFINEFLVNYGFSNTILNTVLFVIISSILENIISIGFDYYKTFYIEQKFGFNNTTLKMFIKDTLRKYIMNIILISIVIAILLSLYLKLGNLFIVYASIFLFLFSFVMMILYIKVFSKFENKFTPLEDGSLRSKIEQFANQVNFNIKDIFIMDGSKRSNKSNAYCAGFGKFKKIVLFDTLINQCTEEEIVAILAHEIGHSKHRHAVISMPLGFLNVILFIVTLFVIFQKDILSTSFGFASIHYGFSIIIFSFFIDIITLFTNIFTNIISRKFEYQADKYAALNYSKEHMITSLKVISNKNFSNLNPHPLTVLLHYSHPPMYKRIEAINNLEEKRGDK